MSLKTWRWLAPALTAALLMPAFAAEPPAEARSDTLRQQEMERARAEMRRARDEYQRAAQELARAAREMNVDSPQAQAWEFMSNPRRAMLGITTAAGPEKGGEVRGVLVTGVTPGSGADKAGLKSGDLLLSANGKPLVAKPKEKPGPERRLRNVMADLEPGDNVKLDYERAGRRSSVTAVASRPGGEFAGWRPMLGWDEHGDSDVLVQPMPPAPPVPPAPPGQPTPPTPPVPPMPPLPPMGAFVPGLQLAKLDEELAGYFKTSDGVLVVRAPKAGTLGLKSGDVIRRINQRSVSSPVAVMQEFVEADAGEKLKLEVWRHGQSVQLEGTPPDDADRRRIHKRVLIEAPDKP